MRFREVFYSCVPRWLRGGDGELALYTLGLMQDAYAERSRLGQEARFPSYAPEDALPYLGRDRAIRRGINEPAEAFAARLLRYLDDHRTQGNPFALLDQLYAYLQAPAVVLRTVDRRGNWFTRAADGTRSVVLGANNWNWDGTAATSWSRFWVIIVPSAGDPWSIPAAYPGSTTLASITATNDEVEGMKSLIREWKPAGTICEWIIVAFDGSKFGPAVADLGGTWGDWSKISGTHRVRARETTARYFVGPRD